MGDQLDVPLEDSELLEEVEMVSALMLAAGENDRQLDKAEIDRLLGVPGDEAADGPDGPERAEAPEVAEATESTSSAGSAEDDVTP